MHKNITHSSHPKKQIGKFYWMSENDNINEIKKMIHLMKIKRETTMKNKKKILARVLWEIIK
jgi:hypothetical protein